MTSRIRRASASGDATDVHAPPPRPASGAVTRVRVTASRGRSLIVGLLAAAILASSQIPVVNGAEPGPQAVVQSFYTWYIAELQGGAVNLRGRPDLTAAFVDWAEHYNDGQMFGGADPVLCAQAIPDSVTAGAAAISGTAATVVVTEVFGEPYKITVGLTLGSAGWQISTGGCVITASVAGHKPDGRIRLGTSGYPGKTTRYHETFVGDDVYNTTGAGQKALVQNFAEVEGSFYTFDITIQNDGSKADRFKIKATGAATGGWKVAYFHGTTNITLSIVAGSFRTASLASGATYAIRARIASGGGNMTRLITIRSIADSTKTDAVKFAYKQMACGC